MFPFPPTQSLHGLLARLADGKLSEHEAVALEILLQNNPHDRSYYRTFVAVHLALQETFQSDAAIIPLPAPRRRPKTAHWLSAAAAVALLGGLFVWSAMRPPHDSRNAGGPGSTATTQPVLAVVATAVNVAWNLPSPAEAGLQLPAGAVHLTKGELVLTLVNGQTLALRSPVSFNLTGEREFDLNQGVVGVKHDSSHGLFVVRLPKGAVVCSDGEFSVQTRQDGSSSLLVFSGAASASTMDPNGRSREETVVSRGGSVDIGEHLGDCTARPESFTRVPLPLPTDSSIADSAYATAVAIDQPVASWRFEETGANRQVPATHGSQPLELMESATLAGPPGRRFLAVDDRQRSGFAYAPAAVATLAREGFTIECLVFSASESHGSAVILESATAPVPRSGPIHHAPQLFAIERMGRMGERIGHIHPDFALRSMLRYPGGYEGGTNLYSSKSHLLHRWHHAALTFDGSVMRLFLDGELTDQADAWFQWETDTVRPIIGRLQPLPQDEHRQWVGGIDEVAIYSRPLPADAILRHYQALRKR